jgi:ornithine cyclodeaminase
VPNDARLLLVDKTAVEQLLLPGDVIAAVRDAFAMHHRREGRVFPVIREQLATGGVFGIKAGDVASQGLLGFKAAGFWPTNRQVGGEAHQATVLLFDPTTGRPQCVIDGNAITTARTAAAGAIGLQLLARPDSRRATVFGTGIQGSAQLTYALQTLPGLEHIAYVTHDRKPNAPFESRFASSCDIRFAEDADAAVAGSDIVITATPGGAPLFNADAVQAGTHLNCVGADTRGKRELPDGVLERARVIVDDHQQAMQLGELQWAPHTPCRELGEFVVAATLPARGRDEITVFDMTGLALQDLTVARLIHRGAIERGLGTAVAWPW